MNDFNDSTSSKAYTLPQLAELLDAELLLRDADVSHTTVNGIAPLAIATPSQVSFLSNSRYRPQLLNTKAAAVIVNADSTDDCPVNCLLHSNPYLAFAKLSHYFDTRPAADLQIHPSAVIADSATIGEGASIAPGVVIMEGVTIGRNARISANTVIESAVSIADNVQLMANVTLYHGVVLGSDVCIHSGSVIGADGFGYAPDTQRTEQGFGWQKIAQLGAVTIGNRVEIGANTTIDRGALDDTIIEDDVIIDNQVQIAHNVVIGRGTAIAGCVGIAGSAIIGKYCNIGGGSGIAGHLSIADGTSVMGMTLINRSVKKPGTYASGTGMQSAASWRKSAVRFTQLEALNQRVKELEKSSTKNRTKKS